MARTSSSTPAHSLRAHGKVRIPPPFPDPSLRSRPVLTSICDPPRFSGAVRSSLISDVPVPSDFSIPYTDLELTTPDNIKIRAFLLLQRPILDMNETPVKWDEKSEEEVRPQGHLFWYPWKLSDMCPADRQFAATRPTVLMFHGNGGNHGHRIPLGKIFFGKMRCNVVMLSYRGHVLLALPCLPLALSHHSRSAAMAILRAPLPRRVRERPLRSYILAHHP